MGGAHVTVTAMKISAVSFADGAAKRFFRSALESAADTVPLH